MFYVSCIVSQLVYSSGGSFFKGGVGSEMIEVVPFFHSMAYTLLTRIGEDKPDAVLATTVLAYSISSVVTGCVFFLLGFARIGSLIGFFPRHILVGCIGGVGWFLISTGIEVSSRIEGSMAYNWQTAVFLFYPMTFIKWTIPLALAFVLLALEHFIKHPLLVPMYFIVIFFGFHSLVSLIPGLSLPVLRDLGWVFVSPEANVPWYSFYSLYNFSVVDWPALFSTIPAMFALTFFGILHVPINVPALAVSVDEDNVDVDRELIAHGISNALSGFCGSIQVSATQLSNDNPLIVLTCQFLELSSVHQQLAVYQKRCRQPYCWIYARDSNFSGHASRAECYRNNSCYGCRSSYLFVRY